MTDKLFLEQLIESRQPFVYDSGRVYLIVHGSNAEKNRSKDNFKLVKGPSLEQQIEFYARNCKSVSKKVQDKNTAKLVDFALFELGKLLFYSLGDSKIDAKKVFDDDYLESSYAKKLGIPVSSLSLRNRMKLQKEQTNAIYEQISKQPVFDAFKGKFLFFDNYAKPLLSRSDWKDALAKSRGSAQGLQISSKAGELKKLREEINNLNYDASAAAARSILADKIIQKQPELEFDNFGFKFSASSVGVHLKIPNYVLYQFDTDEDYHGRYFLMPKTVISTTLSGFGQAHSVHFSRGSSPFEISDGELCFGNYSTSYFSRMPFAEAVTKHLLDAKKVILHGYKSGCNPARNLDEISSARKITPAEIKRRKLSVTNKPDKLRDS